MESFFTCRVPGCGGPASGTCINGLNFDECPDVIRDALADSIALIEENVPDKHTDHFETAVATGVSGSLDAASCDSLLRARGGIMVAIVAGPDVGKTTMIATLYELLYRRRLNGYKFAGSETLRGYEERCHLARLASNAVKPDTPRTRTSAKLSFTHLRVQTPNGLKDIVFSDRSGEHFQNALGKPAQIVDFAEIARANVIFLLVDLFQLQNSPHQTKSQVRRLFLTLVQYGLLVDKRVRLIGTKMDLISDAETRESATGELAALTQDLLRRTVGSLDIQSFVISSRSGSGVKAGDGFDTLVQAILSSELASMSYCSGVAFPTKLSDVDTLMYQFRNRK
jgi:hypothetical protein